MVGDRVFHSWAELGEAVARRAGSLRERFGVGAGEPVALFAGNCPEYLEILFSIWHAGAVAVPLSARLHPREAAELLDACRARLCFVDDVLAEALEPYLDGRTALSVVGSADDHALTAQEPIGLEPRSFDDDAWLFFTSGTTGRAKGARLSHGNLLAMTAAYHADVSSVSPRDSFIHVTALSHASGLFSLPFVSRGAAQVLPPSGRFVVGELLDLVALGTRSTFFVPPTLLRRLCQAPEAQSARVECLGTVLVGAAPVRPSDLRLAAGRLGPCLWNGYGQGETPCTITAMSSAAIAEAVDSGDDELLRSVGVARFATRVGVVGGDGRPLPAGETGEVVVDGPTVMSGYLDMPEESAQALQDGWLHTGDLGRFDDTGHLTLVDRAKEVVITGGYNVYPREVEDVLLADPTVYEAAVIGVPDAAWGERIVAYVVPAAGSAIDESVLDLRCLEAIARHKRPREYRVIAELPRNQAGKVLKRLLRELYQEVGDAAR
jgi:long-chain acyl-CoA synthetase